MLIIKINTNKRLIGAWLPSTRGRERTHSLLRPCSWSKGFGARLSLSPGLDAQRAPAGSQ